MLYVNALCIGAAYGLTVCSWTCLPYIGPYVLGSQEGFLSGVRSAMLFSLGKLISYALLGAFAGYFGAVLSDISSIVKLVSAAVMFFMGCSLFGRGKSVCCTTKQVSCFKNRDSKHLIILGITAGIVPCLPMSALLLYAANTNSALRGCFIASAFGVGTLISPLILISGCAGWLARSIAIKIPKQSLLLRRICGFVLVSAAIKLLLNGLVI